jgi:hypothetical protein
MDSASSPLQAWLWAAEQRVHQHRQLHRRITGLGHAVTDRETGLPRGRDGLLDQAALPQTRATFKQPAGPGPAPQPGQMLVQQGELGVPAAQRIRPGGTCSGNPAPHGSRRDVVAASHRPA